jgi:hypothetical protein
MCLQFGFFIFWQKDLGAKAAHKMMVKLTPGVMLQIVASLTYNSRNINYDCNKFIAQAKGVSVIKLFMPHNLQFFEVS